MSGHSKWHSIKHKKAATDAARGKVFARHAKLITIAAKSGGNPEKNPTLRLTIEKAKADNMPNKNIERAVKKGTGELKEGAQLEETTYEGYGPGGIALMIKCLTDNKNRTIANVRSVLSNYEGRIGEKGCVGWMFKIRGLIILEAPPQEQEESTLEAIDLGAEDVKTGKDTLEVITSVENLEKIKKKLEERHSLRSFEITYLPDNDVLINDEKTAKKALQLLDELQEDDDVAEVYSNFDIPEEILTTLDQ
ncbi:MAG TPA: YebC/PmpR family DNA-binding transcriptional regulator [Candidatus Peregrinibacteria bacterium]|nr:YebC/PmpR family DNA-binding transcriptional regulator [Candidatus Peregrinibacteria bacterium]